MTKKDETVNLVWLGTAGVLISDNETGILIDPYVSRLGIFKVALRRPLHPDKEYIKKWASRFGTKSIQAVAVSHSHFDHALDAPYFALEAGATLIGSASTMNVGRGAGLTEKYLREAIPGETINIGAFALRFIESAHGPAFLGRVPYPGTIDKPLIPPRPAGDYKLGKTFAILISHPSGAIVHHGSAGFVDGMYEGITADVVLLGLIGRGGTQTYLKNIPLQLGAKLVIPIHFDNFFISLGKKMRIMPSARFKEFLSTAERHRSNFELKIPRIGETTAILSQ